MRTSSAILAVESSGISECLDRLTAHKWRNRPLSTYRLQFNRDFTFRQAKAMVRYLDALGVSHCYASPILAARPGSVHGYDIMDHSALNPEIGSEAEFFELVAELKARNMGLVLDVVPNHMGMGEGSNPWWQDVLENGPASEYAGFFDIDWHPLRAELNGKVLLPMLGSQYGEVLERGELRLVYEDGRFQVRYYDKVLPIDPRTIPLIFEPINEARDTGAMRAEEHERAELDAIIAGFRQLPAREEMDLAPRRRAEAAELYRRLRDLLEHSAAAQQLLAAALRLCNGEPGNARSFDALHRLLEAQAYRLAHWRVSSEEINYRRFFDINDLVGVRVEEPRVFAQTHKLLRRLLAEGAVAGLRVDHPDGLFNPAQYFVRLQMLYAASQCRGPEPRTASNDNGIEIEVERAFGEHDWLGMLQADKPAKAPPGVPRPRAPLFVAIEKILEPGEELPREWPVDGTVGYDFLNLLNGVFIDARQRRAFTTLFRRFTGITDDVATLVYDSKKLILNSAMSGELAVLTHLLEEICGADRRARDFTRKSLSDAIRETIACFPVYRTYIDARGNLTERDRGTINEAIARARRRNESMPGPIFSFLRDVLLLRTEENQPADAYRRRLHFTLKFQQLTGPVMAKGLEDTTCYVYNRLISANEVGGTPEQFGVAVDDFHRANMVRLEHWPFALLATSTHDSKRGEDVRARVNVLSEMPRTWAKQAMRWRRINRAKKRVLSDGRSVPDANEEYLLYQTLVGAWPFLPAGGAQTVGNTVGNNGQSGTGPRSRHVPFAHMAPAEREQFLLRMQDYMTKAVHEAKRNLSWVNPNPEYVEALREFVARLLEPARRGRPNTFLEQMEAFLPSVQFFGAINSLAQTLLKLVAPGAPDFYQGTELWNLDLVDPDNRHPVDFSKRTRMMSELDARASDRPALCDQLLADLPSGAAKLWTVMQGLRLRRANPELFAFAPYTPLYGAVEKQEHMLAFARADESGMVVAAAPRLAFSLMKGSPGTPCLPLGDAWGAAELVLPARTPAQFQNVLTGEMVQVTPSHSLLCRELFARFPVALLSGS